jgi:hypothetical protein
MSLFKPRVFTKLNIAYNSAVPFHNFYISQLAYLQWVNITPFVSGPSIYANPSPKTYSYWEVGQKIESTFKYFMTPYNIIMFGNDVENTNKSHILSRVWLNASKDLNNALVLMEPINLNSKDNTEVHRYMAAINNRSWRPLVWSDFDKVNSIHQTLVQTDKPYPGSWNVNMRLY